jgi:hypothetical protein
MPKTLTLRLNDEESEIVEKLMDHYNRSQSTKAIKDCINEFFQIKGDYKRQINERSNLAYKLNETEMELRELKRLLNEKRIIDTKLIKMVRD